MDILTVFYAGFCVLILASGLTAKLCKDEYTEGKTHQASGFWIFESENFTEKGRKLRTIFFVVSNMSLVGFFVILILQGSGS